MGSIIGIPTTRVSDLFVRQRLMNQTQSDELDLFGIQMQLSTGRRFQVPSDDSDAALRVMRLQRLLERKDQVQTNLRTNQSYLTATDTALSTISSNLAEARSVALGVLGTVATDTQREAAVQQIQQTVQQLLDSANQEFRGRYLFAGAGPTTQPFEISEANHVQYLGDEQRLSSYADIDLLFDTNLHGNEVFGAISKLVLGSVDVDPILTFNTRLADLGGGNGIAPGSIAISDGSNTSIVDISSAETIGDVAAMIDANPPQAKNLYVEVTAKGLVIELDGSPGDLLTIREVGGGTTAEELGILTETGTSSPVVGDDLDPIVRLTTRLDDILGTRSRVVVRFSGSGNDLIFSAQGNGTALEDTEITFNPVSGGPIAFTHDPGGQTLTVDFDPAGSTAQDVIDALAADPLSTLFSAALDPLDGSPNDGSGTVEATDPLNLPKMTGGSGADFDKDSGLQIVNGERTHILNFASAETVEDLLNVLNMSDAGVLAEINENATGIDLRSRISGADFMIGENGGTTATQLGLRSFTTATRLEDLNHGRGIVDQESGGMLASAAKQWAGSNNDLIFRSRSTGPAWNGFTISFVEGVPPGTESFTYNRAAKTMQFEISSGSTTANRIIQLFQADPQAAADFALELDSQDGSPNDGSGLVAIGGSVTTAGGETAGTDFTITLSDGTEFEIDISANDGSGYVTATDPIAPPETAGGDPTSYAAATVVSDGLDNDLLFQANSPGSSYNGTKINFQENPGAPAAVASYVPGVELTFDFDPGVSTAQDIIDALLADPGASADFTATLDSTDGSAAETVGDVLTLLGSQDPAKLQARLATYGNGIELLEAAPGAGTLTVTRAPLSTAAIGLGLIPEGQQSNTATLSGGSQTLTGSDVNPLETEGVFTALLRLQAALKTNDVLEAQRAVGLLDEQIVSMNFSRAELGARQQVLDIMQMRLEDENINLQTALSEDFDVDLVQAVSDLTARQVAFEAALRTTAWIFELSLLNFL